MVLLETLTIYRACSEGALLSQPYVTVYVMIFFVQSQLKVFSFLHLTIPNCQYGEGAKENWKRSPRQIL